MQDKISNLNEKEERAHLSFIKEKIGAAIEDSDDNIRNYSKEIQDNKDYLWEHKSGMDHVEKIAVRQSIDQFALTGEKAVAGKERLRKLMLSPYFGRIDFVKTGDKMRQAIYIGIHSFFDRNNHINLIHDWRAPISSMFYDFELGKAGFESPLGETNGEIKLKRQYRIRQGEFEFMLESSLNIHDDILQKELSATSDKKMKDIVATIQRDQNRIIRNVNAQVLIIQGVAGSGKTSIALHRIAFLLYRFKQEIKSDDILIISPNKVFADYISNVLPELGEENIQETGMEELAAELFDNKIRFRTFFEQVSQILEKNDQGFIDRIKFKSDHGFLNRLNEFLLHIENTYFKSEDIFVNRLPVPAWFIDERFKAYHRLPVLKRIPEIVKDIGENINIFYRYEINTEDRNAIRKALLKMLKTSTLRILYKEFFQWLGHPEMFKYSKGTIFEYSDVFPLLYLKIRMEGIRKYEHIKHLLIDEMQDYTPVQYSVLSKLFPCNKTILGDINQSVNPHSSSPASEIQKVYPQAETMELHKSYRSTFEITAFAQRIQHNSKQTAIKRHGDKPVVAKLQSEQDELNEIKKIVSNFYSSRNKSLGIICKTQKQAQKLYDKLISSHPDIISLSAESIAFANGAIITTIHMSKGLEFDEVVVPHCNDNNYITEMDKHLLYIACTRAMHKLSVTCCQEITPFLH